MGLYKDLVLYKRNRFVYLTVLDLKEDITQCSALLRIPTEMVLQMRQWQGQWWKVRKTETKEPGLQHYNTLKQTNKIQKNISSFKGIFSNTLH